MKITRFEDLEAWQRAREMVRMIYTVVNGTPLKRDYRLSNQITGAAVSVMSNVAEGFDRGTNREFVRFLRIARASASEVRSHLYVALDQQYVDKECFESCARLVSRTQSIIGGLIRYLAQQGAATRSDAK